MKIIMEFNNSAGSPAKRYFSRLVVKRTLEESGYNFPPGVAVRVSVALVSPETIREINRTYRKKDRSTDVLSFAEYRNKSELRAAPEKDIFLGEILLCYNDIVRYANSTSIDARKEFARVLSHGVLHLLGFRHGKKMFFIQEKIGEKI